ncbi:hypothetical protein LIA77_00747 [Sarocladium implicatum]|nr:hypothetical protein LIA77_00747 [Sarocladium implicatum]
MAPIRRYLRISKYSVLECRIYLDNPALAQSWLLNPRNPVLPRVIESIRPLVLPKLREERERSKKKSTKKKTVKDVVAGDDFEVSMFLTETATRHSLLSKKKHFHEKAPKKMQSNSNRLIAESDQAPVDVEAAQMLREESDDEHDNTRLADIPLAPSREQRKRSTRTRDDEDSIFVSEDDAVEINSDEEEPPHKRARALGDVGAEDEDDKKKLAMDISYEGFAIYGRVLCLVIQKRENTTQISRKGKGSASTTKLDGQAKMENWITSTQIPAGEDTS